MAKTPKIKIDKVEPVVVPQSETPVVETEKLEVKTTHAEWPEAPLKGKFHAVAWKGGYVVFNPQEQRITEVISKDLADDMVRRSNLAAQIK